MSTVKTSTKTQKIFLKYQTEATELKNTLEVFNRRLDKAEEKISDLEDRAV